MEAAATDIKVLKRFEVLRLANGRLERPNNRGLWRQTAGCNALTTNTRGRSAWWKEPRGILRVLRGLSWQTAGFNALATEGYGGKRQAATL